MKPVSRWLWSVALAGLGSTCVARIGESPSQCAVRYGEEFGQGAVVREVFERYYRRGALVVNVTFQNNKAVAVTYYKRDLEQRVLPFSEGEIWQFLVISGEKANWHTEEGEDSSLHFTNKRDNLHATSSRDLIGLTVWNFDYLKSSRSEGNDFGQPLQRALDGAESAIRGLKDMLGN